MPLLVMVCSPLAFACSTYWIPIARFPLREEQVRVLLEKVDLGDGEQLWGVVAPMIDRSGSSRLFDNAIDAHLGKARPSNYQSGALPIPPPP